MKSIKINSLPLAIVLACSASNYCDPVFAEIVTLDNFKCSPQTAAIAMPTSVGQATTDYAPTVCDTNKINTLSVKRQLNLTAFNNVQNYAVPSTVAFAVNTDSASVIPSLGTNDGGCNLRYTFDTVRLNTASSIRVTVQNTGTTMTSTGIGFYNGATSYQYAPSLGINTLTFKITDFNRVSGKSVPILTSLASFHIHTSCSAHVKSVVIDKP